MLLLGAVVAGQGGAQAAEPPRQSDLAQGLELFQAREFQRALPLLERAAAADPGNLDTQLLLGITLYRLAADRQAEPFLQAATRSVEPETSSSARFFLGL